jgi:hypothetical protein
MSHAQTLHSDVTGPLGQFINDSDEKVSFPFEPLECDSHLRNATPADIFAHLHHSHHRLPHIPHLPHFFRAQFALSRTAAAIVLDPGTPSKKDSWLAWAERWFQGNGTHELWVECCLSIFSSELLS